MDTNPNRPATLADLESLEQRIDQKMDAKLDVFKTELKSEIRIEFRADLEASSNALRDALTERMRDMQTELLRGFASFASGQDIRMRKLEADTSNIDISTTKRLSLLEQWMIEIREKLAANPPLPPAPPAAPGA